MQLISTPAGLEAESADLFLRVVARDTGAALASDVLLQPRPPLGAAVAAPAPQLLRVTEEGLLIAGLAPGLYGVHVRARLRTGPDPPDFVVLAPRTEVDLTIDVARRYGVWLRVCDERGAAALLGRQSSGYDSVPELDDPFGDGSRRAAEPRATGMDFGSRWISVQDYSRDQRFFLGMAFDLDCNQSGAPWWTFTPKGRTPVVVKLPAHELRFELESIEPKLHLTLLAVSLPAAYFDQAIRLPDGRPARDAGADIRIECRPALAGAPDEGDAWRHVPVHVDVRLAGFEPLSFSYSLAQGEPQRRVLVPLADGG